MPSPQVSAHVHQLLDEHWAATLNVEPSVWHDTEVVVASHPERLHRDHVYLVRRQDSCIIVVPEALVGATTVGCASWPSAAVFDRAFVRSLYGVEVAAIQGPFWMGYATGESFRHLDGRGTRRLEGGSDAAALTALRSQVTQDEAVDAGFTVSARREYGCFVGRELVCAGTLTPFGGLPANIGVLTHPGHRNQGYGTAMVSALVREALAESRIVQFRVLEENRAALRVARVLGFVEDAHILEVRLRHAGADADRVSR